jgi:dihydrofolate reductase
VSALKKLRSQNGKHMVLWGSLSLAKSLMKENLVDELHIRIVPVVLGKGISLFQNTDEKDLKLVSTRQYPSGIVLMVYRLSQPAL